VVYRDLNTYPLESPMMHPLIAQTEELFLPELQRLASEMRQLHPTLRFNVWHDPVGSLTDYQGYALGVECVFPKSSSKRFRRRLKR